MRKMRAGCLADLMKMAGKLGLAKGSEVTMLRAPGDSAENLTGRIFESSALAF